MPDGLAAPSEENTGICLSQFKRLSRKFGQDVCLLELSSHDTTLMTCPPGCCSNNLKIKIKMNKKNSTAQSASRETGVSLVYIGPEDFDYGC